MLVEARSLKRPCTLLQCLASKHVHRETVSRIECMELSQACCHLFHLVPREICNDVNTNPNLARALPYFTGRNGSLTGGQGGDEKIFNLVYPLGIKICQVFSNSFPELCPPIRLRNLNFRQGVSREDEKIFGPFPAAFKMQIASTEEKHDKPEGNMAHA
ncbi:hypothetical protein HZH66_010210 [Vespula vulgaris]|uniref:Uncharacterized protein n=1 Tax=Vespula vulgaris TaxID=7454 RepID=A0A834MZY1_VESVU|nr:hypothetical protein HZH66_010210 [Vespula vulgaris]